MPSSWNPQAIHSSLLEAEASLLERLSVLAPECKQNVEKAPKENPDGIPQILADQLKAAQAVLKAQHAARNSAINMLSIWARGGHEGWAVDIRLAALDHDSDGILNDEIIDDYMQMSERVADGVKDFATNNGVVAALMISVLLPLSIQMINDYDTIFEDETEARALAAQEQAAGTFQSVQYATLDGRYSGWDNVDVPFYCNAVAFVMINLSSLLAIMLVAVCARIYTQISFWMPNLESKVWYAQMMADTLQSLETMKTLLLILTMSSMVLMAFAKAVWLGIASAVPTVLLMWWYLRLELKVNDLCTKQLIEQTRMILPEARNDAKQTQQKKKQELRAKLQVAAVLRAGETASGGPPSAQSQVQQQI